MKDEYNVEELEELVETHREKFIDYWALNDNEEKLVEDFSESFKRLINGEMEKSAMKRVIEDIIRDEK